MNEELRSKYVQFIASLYRFVKKETSYEIPESAKLVVNNTSPLVEIDSIIGVDIMIVSMNTPDEFSIAFVFEDSPQMKSQLKAIKEFFNLYSFNP